MTPAALTLRYLRRAGYLVEAAERWIPRANMSRDLFGVIDLVAITVDEPVLGIQATSLSNVSARVKKAQHCPALAVWLKNGCRFQVIGWSKQRRRWFPKIVELRAGDLAAMVLTSPPRRGRALVASVDLFASVGEDDRA